MGLREEVETALPQLRARCESVVAGYGAGENLAAALGGLYFAFKSMKFVARLHDDLMADPGLVNQGNGDEAGYFAEAMVRSVHSTGDLLATALVECGQVKRPKGDTFFSKLDLSASDPMLRDRVDGIRVLPAWEYVAAFSNTAKHNAFIDRTSVRSGESQEIEFAAFDHKRSPQPERTFGEVLEFCLELLRGEEAVLDWLLVRASTARKPAPPAPGLEYQASSITATFTPPSAASFLRRSFSPSKDDDSD